VKNSAFPILLFICFWLALNYLISFFTGWLALAEIYRATQPFEGERWHFQSAKFRFTSGYKHVLTIGSNKEGLFLSVFFLFRVGHAPLFIPWQDISVRPAKFLWFRMFQFEFRQVPSIKVRLREKLGEKIQAAAGQFWPGDRASTGAAF